jgi:hypothetical protein
VHPVAEILYLGRRVDPVFVDFGTDQVAVLALIPATATEHMRRACDQRAPKLVLAEHPVAGSLTTAGTARSTGWRLLSRIVAALCDCAGASADEPFYFPAALGAGLDRSFRHFLALFKTARTGIT